MAPPMAQVTARAMALVTQRRVRAIAEVTAHRTAPVAAGARSTTDENVRRVDEALRAMKDE